MPRFYLRLAVAVSLVAAAARPTSGQTIAALEHPPLGVTLTAEVLRQLPTSNNPFTLFDTVQAEAIGDGFVAAGLNVATAPKTGGFLNSWSQTQFRIGDINITDPRAGGTPLLMPIVPMAARLTVAAASMDIDDAAPALSMTLEALRPGAAWSRSFEGSLSGSSLVGKAGTNEPPVDRVNRWEEFVATVSGPLSGKVGLAALGSWRGLSHFTAVSPEEANDGLATAFAQIAIAATPRDDIRALGWIERATVPALEDNGFHVQSTWERHNTSALSWRVFGGFTSRSRTAASAPIVTVDSLTGDPVSDLLSDDGGSTRRWTIGARLSAPPARRLPAIGIDLDGASMRVDRSGLQQIHELVDGTPARLWTVRTPTATDSRHSTAFAVHANEHITAGPITVDAALRLDTLTASANAAERGVQWTTLLPRALVQWQVTQKAGVALTAGYRRSAYQLPLDLLAVGDPAAPVADVARWTGPLIARVGPGTGGDPSLTQIDPNLKRPTTDELLLAIRARPFQHFEIELARVTKREQPLFALFNTGVPASSYGAFQVPDPSYVAATAGPFDEPFVTVLNRPAGAYGRDRYLLTNRTDDPEANSWGMELNMRASSPRVLLLATIGLTWAKGPAAAVGFLPTENDQNVLGNTFVDPNTYSDMRGQLFQDRSHVGKIAGIYRFPHRVTIGAIARYQDGQPFGRVVFVPELNQGPMVVRAYRNGGAAFTYTGTFDTRLQWSFTRGRAEITLNGDIYNLPNMGKEVAEYIVAGPRFRTPTMLQPPRTAVLGARVAF